jgi:hypothetical protein
MTTDDQMVGFRRAATSVWRMSEISAGPTTKRECLDGHCHINRKTSRLNEARGLKADHPAFRVYVSSCQTSKIEERIIQ